MGEIPFLISSGLNRHHDLIVMNQRGTFLSEPALTDGHLKQPGNFHHIDGRDPHEKPAGDQLILL